MYLQRKWVEAVDSSMLHLQSSILQRKKKKMEQQSLETLSRSKTAKSRLSKENKDVTVRLYYDERGLDRYYGLLELGEIGGLWKNVAGRYEMTVDGETKKVYAKAILKDPEVYFTPEVMEKLDEIAREQFRSMDPEEYEHINDDPHDGWWLTPEYQDEENTDGEN